MKISIREFTRTSVLLLCIFYQGVVVYKDIIKPGINIMEFNSKVLLEPLAVLGLMLAFTLIFDALWPQPKINETKIKRRRCKNETTKQ